MQDNNEVRKHEMTLIYNEKVTLSAVKSVPSFDNNAVEVVLDDAKLRILGENLEIDKLDLVLGELTLTGKVKSMTYYKGDLKKNLMKRIFK